MISIEIIEGDICRLKVDAIVNPANSFGYMGGGVAGVIKRHGGKQIELEAVAKAPIQPGTAILTTAGELDAEYVIHAPTMIRPTEQITIKEVGDACLAALDLADAEGMKVIAMPGLGTGVGGVPYDKAAEVIVKTIKAFQAKSLEKVILIDIKKEMIEGFKKALEIS